MQNELDLPANAMEELAGLDYDFLRYMGVRSETQRTIQEFYLPHFLECSNVLDIGCGDCDFVKLLLDNGVQATGVDSDDKARKAAETSDLPFVQEDVFDYLRTVQPASVDGIFCAHLVEHLPYERVVELVHNSFQALEPGGVIVLATPDVRSLFSHLEMFYLHFGHISFYHPRLLCFFLDHAGFTDTEYGSNPRTASPLMSDLNLIANTPAQAAVACMREIPPQGDSLLHRASYSLKRRLARWLVQPFLDDLTHSVNQEMERTRGELRSLAASLQTLNGPFECYAVAYKPRTTSSTSGNSQSAV